MLFNSYTFWLFFALVLLLYHQLSRRPQNWLLLIGSYIFYGFWNWKFLGLVFFSTIVDFSIGLALGKAQSRGARKALITASIGVQLGLLGFFKYYNFFAHEFAALMAQAGLHFAPASLNVILPVGISFYTFQSMSYTIDVYRRAREPVTGLLDFALYVCFFPQLVAGPIERSHALVPQFQSERRVTPQDVVEGIYLILIGLFKKIVIADNLAAPVSTLFSTPANLLSGGDCWAGVYAFAFQIYGDFSGYSSIAQGVARLMGFRLIDNFNMPYFAASPSEFWQRWHISLSRWLRDYLYISLGGNRRGKWKTYRNLMLTMVLGGLWHGANWTFLAWGFFHGLLLCLWRLAAPEGAKSAPNIGLWRPLKMLLMFHLVCVGWLFIRAGTIAQSWTMLTRMLTNFKLTPFGGSVILLTLFYALPLFLYEYWLHRSGDQLLKLTRVSWISRGLVYAYLVVMLLMFAPPVPSEFIYFQF